MFAIFVCMCVCWRLREKVQTLLVPGGFVNRLLGISPFFLPLCLCLSLFVAVVDPTVVTSYMQDATFGLVTASRLSALCAWYAC